MMIYNLYESGKLIGDHDIADGDTLSFTLDGDGDPRPPFWFDSLESKRGDSIYLNFANERYQAYCRNKEDAIFWEGYRGVEITKYNIIFYWEFTEEDYENATVMEP